MSKFIENEKKNIYNYSPIMRTARVHKIVRNDNVDNIEKLRFRREFYTFSMAHELIAPDSVHTDKLFLQWPNRSTFSLSVLFFHESFQKIRD